MNHLKQQYLSFLQKRNQIGLDDLSDWNIAEQKGGLFNTVYRLYSKEQEWFVKKYEEGFGGGIFSPPKIAPSDRCRLAYEAQKLGRESNTNQIKVPLVIFDELENSLFIEGVQKPRDLILDLSQDTPEEKGIISMGKYIGRFHRNSFEKIPKTKLFLNEEFRDFKLDLQYSKIAEQLNDPFLTEKITKLKDRYSKEQMTLLHGDLNSRNCIRNQATNELFVIDFEQAHFGNPIYDLAYFLSEIYISYSYFKKRNELKKMIPQFLDAYQKENRLFNLIQYKEDFKNHLLVQIIYRFLGPSKKSWTFYVDQNSSILKNSIQFLKDGKEEILDDYFQ